MRIEFPNTARNDFPWTGELLRIGSAPDNDLVVSGDQVAQHHVRIAADRRGWVLETLPAAGRVHVNARPVRERALLRAGDMVGIGDCRLLFCADEHPARREAPAVAPDERRSAALRAVAGTLSGQVLPIGAGLTLGQGGEHALVLPQDDAVLLHVDWHAGCLRLRVVQSPRYHALRVNGTAVHESVLLPGDQIGIAMHRFIVDAPGPRLAPANPRQDAGRNAEGRRSLVREAGWLVATAALLALGITLVLLLRS